ncbi:hypothetical protein [Psychrobacter sp.]|uniref:hypothetical protein n=1 Tax=Psychrobacter sp. TaxID=56811 RepID=UPI0025FAD030|nr:hypothetical protein [Psychrobacter sp.]
MKNCSKNILVQSRKFIALSGLALLAVNVSAHADLTISSGIQNSGTQTSNASNDTMINQVSNTALDHQLPSDASIAKLMQVMHIDAQI